MIILDTDVLSELLRPAPEQRIIDWLDKLPGHAVATTSTTAAELWYGVRRMPEGRRREKLTGEIDAILYEDLDGRVESFDLSAAGHYADILTARQQQGRPIGTADAQIAAICASRNATLATGNTKDFEGTGISVVNPWEQA